MWGNIKSWWRAFKDAAEMSDNADKALRWLGFPITGAALATMFGFIVREPDLAILIGSLTFAALTTAALKFIEIKRRLEAYRLLSGDGAMAVATTQGDNTLVNVQLFLRNASQRLLFYKLQEAALLVNGSNNPDARIITAVEPILAGEGKLITIATVTIPNHIGRLTGNLKVVAQYGLKASKLGYVYTWETSIEGESSRDQTVPLRTGNFRNEHSQIVIED